jgi:DNA-binding Xre family transcriptional regulator
MEQRAASNETTPTLHEVLRAKKLRSDWLAMHIGVDTSTVSHWRERGVPKARIAALCELLDVEALR